MRKKGTKDNQEKKTKSSKTVSQAIAVTQPPSSAQVVAPTSANTKSKDIHPLSAANSLAELDNFGQKTYPIYKERLDLALSSDRIKNIAISGDFGIGKSSVINIYESENANSYYWLHVSVGGFYQGNLNTSDSQVQQNDVPLESKQASLRSSYSLEQDLLRQITAECSYREIPRTSLKLVPQKINKNIRIASAIVSALLIAAIYLLVNLGGILAPFGEVQGIQQVVELILHAIIVSIGATGVGALLYHIYPRLRMPKISLKTTYGDMDVEQPQEESALDANCFELVYILEQLAIEHRTVIVVFEDLDRFNIDACIETFGNLYEINSLVNRRLRRSGEGNKVVFIYAANDDLYGSIEKEKFFDYIISIIPPISSRTAHFKIHELLQNELGITPFQIDDRGGSLLKLIAQEFSDYRKLLHILDEYCAYHKAYYELNNAAPHVNTLDADLLAFLVYKNLAPLDYRRAKEGKSILSTETPNIDASIPLIVKTMHEKGYISTSSLRYIGYSEDDILDQYHAVLSGGDCWRRNDLVEATSINSVYYCIKALHAHQNMISDYLTGVEFKWLNVLLSAHRNSDDTKSMAQDCAKKLPTALSNGTPKHFPEQVDNLFIYDYFESDDVIQETVLKCAVLMHCTNYLWFFGYKNSSEIHKFSLLVHLLDPKPNGSGLIYLSEMLSTNRRQLQNWLKQNIETLAVEEWSSDMIKIVSAAYPNAHLGKLRDEMIKVQGKTKSLSEWVKIFP